MASQILPDGKVEAPLNIQAPAPLLSLKGFHWGTVDEKLRGPTVAQQTAGLAEAEATETFLIADVQQSFQAKPKPGQATVEAQLGGQLGIGSTSPAPDFPLTQFQGAFAGNGFNTIFRPRPANDKTFSNNPQGPGDNILELNLTTEQLTFGATLGKIPNRGGEGQPDIFLGGLPYLQTVQDVTNPATGKGDSPEPTGIHFEPGVWLTVPKANFNTGPSVVRMASIPHGTTINAQGLAPAPVSTTAIGGAAGPPQIPDIDTTPFNQNDPTFKQNVFPSMNADNLNTFRLPQDLTKFKAAGTITTEIIKNPHIVLRNAIKGLNIEETISFDVSTGPPSAQLGGGGTANISFLQGAPNQNDPIADAAFMHATVWIERVNYEVVIPQLRTQTTLMLRPTMPPGSTAPTPVFAITTPVKGVPALKTITVPGIQLQISQTVNLNFVGLSWPHVSVSTLVPTNPQPFQMT